MNPLPTPPPDEISPPFIYLPCPPSPVLRLVHDVFQLTQGLLKCAGATEECALT